MNEGKRILKIKNLSISVTIQKGELTYKEECNECNGLFEITLHDMESKDTSPLPKCRRRGIGVAYIIKESITKLASFNTCCKFEWAVHTDQVDVNNN